MKDQIETLDEMALDALAHEVWAASQLGPGEGIDDAVARIKSILKSAEVAK